MLQILLFLALFTNMCGDEFPVMHEGRIRPYTLSGEEFSGQLHALPDRYKPDWHPLSDLDKLSYNFTPYPDEAFSALVDAWKKRDMNRVKAMLALASPQLRMQAEKLYFNYPWKVIAVFLYIGAAILFLLSASNGGMGLFIGAFALHTFLLALRCYILHRPPVSNMQETVIYVPWIANFLSLFWYFRNKETLPCLLGAILASILLLTPFSEGFQKVPPVLNSNLWLIIHVMMIVASYGVLILSGFFSHLYLFTKSEKAFRFILPSMYIGVALLIPGTILGGIWAAQSWGRFWDWDPKESWAFISAAIYLAVIHAWRYQKINRIGLAAGSILGMVAISFTWYGVNYILGTGLHSYGFGNGGELFYWIFLSLEILIISTSLILNVLKNNSPYDKNKEI